MIPNRNINIIFKAVEQTQNLTKQSWNNCAARPYPEHDNIW